LAVSCDHRVSTGAGRVRADALAATLPRRAWQPLSAGEGAKGPRLYDWAWISVGPDAHDVTADPRWLLIRRNQRTRELAYCRCYAPGPATLARLVNVAGRRWSTEENFQTAKTLTGLDQHQVRRWRSWHRWTLLAMLAHAFLTVIAVGEQRAANTASDQIPFTRNEIRHLFATLVLDCIGVGIDRWHWSIWRRRHQHRARISHYRRRSAAITVPG
jgi:SRSO17 transposase